MTNDRHYSSTDVQLSEEQREVLPKIQKLLSLAAKNTSPEEAASAAAKAQDLLLAYNLSSDLLEIDLEGGTRGREQMKGGSREYERDLWGAVAELNFCLHWVGQEVTDMKRRFNPKPGDRWYGVPLDEIPERMKVRKQRVWKHFLIGRMANVRSTIAMAVYLQARVDALAMEFVYNDEKMRYSQSAMSFREGAVEVITSKLWDRRREQMAEERRKQQEAQERASKAAEAGISMSTALTISSVLRSETDANYELRYGLEPGELARTQAAKAAKRRAAEEEYTRWAAAHPEEAAAHEKERREQQEKADARRARGGAGSRGGSVGKAYDPRAWRAGREAGRDIGLDQQASAVKPKAYL